MTEANQNQPADAGPLLSDQLGPLPGNAHNDELVYSSNMVADIVAAKVAAERERCKACVQYSQVRNGYHDDHGQRIGHYNVRMFQWIDSGHDPRA